MAKKKQYLVKAKNPEYSGKTYGIRFERGEAIVSERTLDKNLKYTLEQVIEGLQKDFRFTVEEITD